MRRACCLTLVLTILAACGGSPVPQPPLLVSAAASLSDAFGEIKLVFEKENLGVAVLLNLAGTSALREQIMEGAPTDVFASANASNMDSVVKAGEVLGTPQVFASNRLQIAVPAGNPAGVEGLQDFSHPKLLIGLCAEGVPCGDSARQALASAGVTPAIDTNEPDVRALLTKIEAGDLDAGITYVTDIASSAGKVEGIDIPNDVNVTAEYQIAILAHAPNPRAADRFVSFVLSSEGQLILARHGFRSP